MLKSKKLKWYKYELNIKQILAGTQEQLIIFTPQFNVKKLT